MNTAVEAGLTKEHINALLKADDVYFVYSDGKHSVRCVKRVTPEQRESDPYADDKYYDIEVDGRIDNYEKDDQPVHSCFTNVWGGRGVWQVVKPGDKLIIFWVRGNYSELTRESGLAVDEVSVIVQRGEYPKTKEMRFLMDSAVTKKNSARMTRSALEVRG